MNISFRRISTYLLLPLVAVLLSSASCGSRLSKQETSQPVNVVFNADSAYYFCQKQCSFGERTMNSRAHDLCGEWIADKFMSYGMNVFLQQTVVKGYDGTPLNVTNIIAEYKPELAERLLLCAHWDTRPWADNDPDTVNWHNPIMGANDGASGVGVLLETARLLASSDSVRVGVDFVCFDAEDWGFPEWEWGRMPDPGDTWALGSQYWADNNSGKHYRFGILLDMVGGIGSTFYQEGMSCQYAQHIVDKVWSAASTAGYLSLFPPQTGAYVTDDHVYINEKAGIPTIDIIPFFPDCPSSTFGPTWHTVDDTMDNIDRKVLEAVGQTIVQVVFSEL